MVVGFTFKKTMSTRGLHLTFRGLWLSGILHIEFGKGSGESKTETDTKNRESGLFIWLERLSDPT
jgi:hypothetical protein